MSEPLTKVDSAVQGLSTSPPKEKGHRRASSSAAGVMNINDLGKVSLRRIRFPAHILSPDHSRIASRQEQATNESPTIQRPKELSCSSNLTHKRRDGKLIIENGPRDCIIHLFGRVVRLSDMG